MTTLRERQLSECFEMCMPKVKCVYVQIFVFICVLANSRCFEANAQLKSATYEEYGQWTNVESVDIRQSWSRYYFSTGVCESTQRNGCNSSCVSILNIYKYLPKPMRYTVYNTRHTCTWTCTKLNYCHNQILPIKQTMIHNS